MAGLIIRGNQSGYTSISNLFIDHYMASSSATYLKTYILLLRLVQAGDRDITLARMADILECGERDIMRSLKYWAGKGFLSLAFDEDGSSLAGITLTQPDQADQNKKKQAGGKSKGSAAAGGASKTGAAGAGAEIMTATGAGTGAETDAVMGTGAEAEMDAAETSAAISGADGMNGAEGSTDGESAAADPADSRTRHAVSGKGKIDFASASQDETFSRLMYVIQQYLQKPLDQKSMEVFSWMYSTLGMDASLIEYLVESCVDSGQKNIRYMETVASDWHARKIMTVEQARIYRPLSSKNVYEVMNALGLSGRKPASAERKLIDGWFQKYQFPLDLVVEACNRTIVTIHEPNFKYVESILLNWKKAGICSTKQLPDYDKAFQKDHDDRRQARPSDSPDKPVKKASGRNSGFHNFQEREYDYDDIARRLRESDSGAPAE